MLSQAAPGEEHLFRLVRSVTDPHDTSQLRPAGTVSVTGASNLDDLQAKLAEKPARKVLKALW
jgi:MqsR-controlled colanic acid and biofilm protein A